METRVNITYTPSQSKEVFGTFMISFKDHTGTLRSTGLKIDPKELWEFARDTTSVAFDFLIFAFIVYNVDRAINRIANSVDGWERTIVLENIPSVNFNKMSNSSKLFQRAINFLTGDQWHINFIHIPSYNYSPSKNIIDYNRAQYDKV